MKINCNVCQVDLEKERPCGVCGYDVCSIHSTLVDDVIMCDYCSGENTSFFDRDTEDFAGTGE